MKLTRVIAVATSAAALAVVPLSGAGAAPGGTGGGASSSPTAVCAVLAAEPPSDEGTLYEFIGTKPGACESTIASVGLDGLMSGAFPSNAAAVGNCKALEQEFPNGYPYQFYGGFLDNAEAIAADFGMPIEVAEEVAIAYTANAARFTARNRAGCVRVLRGLHSGELFGLIGLGGPGA